MSWSASMNRDPQLLADATGSKRKHLHQVLVGTPQNIFQLHSHPQQEFKHGAKGESSSLKGAQLHWLALYCVSAILQLSHPNFWALLMVMTDMTA